MVTVMGVAISLRPSRNSYRGKATRRKPVEWAVRGALAAVIAIFGYWAVIAAAGNVVADTYPDLARSLAPGDGRITARQAAALSSTASAADRRSADQLASLALRQDATAVIAVATLGGDAQARGDTEAARRLFSYASQLSRRNLATQLWSIEDAVNRGDVAGALHHYDIALRVHSEAYDTLFSVLTPASREASIRTELIKTLAANPAWSGAFLTYVAGNGGDPRAAASLFGALDRAGIAVPALARARVIDELVARGFADEAWRFYAVLHAHVDRRRSRDPRFVTTPDIASVLDWTAINEGGVNAAIQHGAVDITAPAAAAGRLFEQVELLPPGTYTLFGHSIGIEQTPDARPYWALRCQGGGELGRVVIPNSADANGTFVGTFTVPVGCAIQTLALVARPSDAVGGLSGQIDRAELKPVQ